MEYRLNKYISNSGICSRREADKYIEQGRVTINGKRATIGMRVLPGQKVKVNGTPIENDIEPVYIAFNKPIGIVCTTDTDERDNIVDYVGHQQRIFPIGRLDKDSQGLILLTNDGDIVNKILRVGNNHSKVYIVTVDRPITDEFLKGMSNGVPILDRVTRRCKIEKITPFIFQITLTQGLNRQIRRMCEFFDYQVLKLERIQVMNVKLGNLPQGEWRDLTEREMEELFDMMEDSAKVAKPAPVKKKPKPRFDNPKSEVPKGRPSSGKSTKPERKDAKSASKNPKSATKPKSSASQKERENKFEEKQFSPKRSGQTFKSYRSSGASRDKSKGGSKSQKRK